MADWNAALDRFGSFEERGLFLLAVGALVASLDLALHGRRATRWREYALLLLAALVGACCGMAVDAVTSLVSPEYFVGGKGIVPGVGFHGRAMALGARAGAGFGALLGGVLMLAAGRGFSLHPSARRHVASACVEVSLWALGVGVAALPAATVSRVSLSWLDAGSAFGGDELQRRSAVWLCHLGVYAGALIGVVIAIRELRQWRATTGVALAGEPLPSHVNSRRMGAAGGGA